ncbi:MAG: serine/threonine-protein kinase, partial [Stackebrandtia sp.]
MMAPHGQTWPSETDFPDLSDVSVIARGAHATVYGAFQVSAGRKVALKIDNRRLAPDSDDRRRFQQEARAVGQLSEHPGIIDTYIAGFTSQGNPYMVTELCQMSYADRIGEHGRLLPDEVQRVGVRIADALAEAHDHRVLHRDIKPANLLIDTAGHPVLADFGVASLMDSRVGEPVVRAAMTPAYAPLETFHLRPSGEPGDVYSLAATLYALPGNPADSDKWRQIAVASTPPESMVDCSVDSGPASRSASSRTTASAFDRRASAAMPSSPARPRVHRFTQQRQRPVLGRAIGTDQPVEVHVKQISGHRVP